MFPRASEYLHALEGRLRIRLGHIKRSPARAAQAEEELRGWHGIEQVKANPVTGSVLIHYDPRRLPPHELIGTLMLRGYFRDPGQVATRMLPARPQGEVGQWLESLGCLLLKTGLKRLWAALL